MRKYSILYKTLGIRFFAAQHYIFQSFI